MRRGREPVPANWLAGVLLVGGVCALWLSLASVGCSSGGEGLRGGDVAAEPQGQGDHPRLGYLDASAPLPPGSIPLSPLQDWPPLPEDRNQAMEMIWAKLKMQHALFEAVLAAANRVIIYVEADRQQIEDLGKALDELERRVKALEGSNE
jgi:hypothetical protein